MLKRRVMPCLLLRGESLVKTIQFKKFNYIGDPINAVKIFNDCEVDELVILDITATTEKREPNYALIGKIVNECFVPLAYGGGVNNIEQMTRLFKMGIEKICVNTALFENPEFIKSAVDRFGAQSIVASIDCKKNLFGHYETFTRSGTNKIKMKIEDVMVYIESLGVGEVMINDISRDGMMEGYNLELIDKFLKTLKTPLIAIGGAGSLEHLKQAFELGIKALAAGSLFVYKSKLRGVLINYPNKEIEKMR